MKNVTLQDTLTFETLEPEEVLKRAIKFEHSKLTILAFQRTNAATAAGIITSYTSGVEVKQEPVMAEQNSNGNIKRQQFKMEKSKQQNNTRPTNSSGQTKPYIKWNEYLIKDT